jgi:aromatic-L-amino-acid decarboxylase
VDDAARPWLDPAAELREAGPDVLAWAARYLDEVADRPVFSEVAPGWVRDQLPAHPPPQAEPWEAILADLDRVVVPGTTHWQSPGWYAYFQSNSSAPAVLAEALITTFGTQGMLWRTGPACTELETLVLDWLAELLGLPDRFRSDGPGGGVIQDSASSSTLVATLAARDRARRTGAHLDDLVAYTSVDAHSSVEKGLRVAGLLPEQLRSVAVDAHRALDPTALRAVVDADLADGRVPFLVVATVGTTSTHGMDPLGPIAEVSRAHGAWLHVDAAHAGAAAICPEHRWIHDGVAAADSYVVDPHKWLFTAMDCSALYVADAEPLADALSITPEYLRNAASGSGDVVDYRDWQVPLGRRFRALKLWTVIRRFGADGLRDVVGGHVALAQGLAERLRADERFDVPLPVPLNLVCFGLRAGDDAGEELLDALNATGRVGLSHTRIDGRFLLRVSVGQTTTTAAHVDELWHLIDRLAPA